jgi:hypothetical protein
MVVDAIYRRPVCHTTTLAATRSRWAPLPASGSRSGGLPNLCMMLPRRAQWDHQTDALAALSSYEKPAFS